METEQQVPHPKLTYVNLGHSGLKVSKFSYGNWVNSQENEDAQKIANTLVKKAWDSGINYFDTAEAYDAGKGERQMGIALKALNVPRSDYVVSTKIFWGKFPDNTTRINNFGTSAKRLREGIDRSLKNLGLPYVDVVFCHRYDEGTPTLEVVRAIKKILDSGKALYWGTQTWPAVRLMEAILLCDKIGCPRPIAEQCQYSMLCRDPVEKEYTAIFDDYGVGTTIWSPLASGILTGKYNNGIPDGSRFDKAKRYNFIYQKWLGDNVKDSTIKKLNELADIAKELGCQLAQLALAWTLKSKDVTTCILGASKISQLEENLDALNFVEKITDEVSTKIEGILGNRPELGMDYRNSGKLAPRR